MRLSLALVLLAGCGGGSSLTSAQQDSLNSALEAQQAVAAECAPDAGCKPSRVRAMERAAYCDVGSVLSELGSPPDAGIACPKK